MHFSTFSKVAVAAMVTLNFLTAALGAPSGVCGSGIYAALQVLAGYPPAESYCSQHYPVPPVTSTVTAPTSVSTATSTVTTEVDTTTTTTVAAVTSTDTVTTVVTTTSTADTFTVTAPTTTITAAPVTITASSTTITITVTGPMKIKRLATTTRKTTTTTTAKATTTTTAKATTTTTAKAITTTTTTTTKAPTTTTRATTTKLTTTTSKATTTTTANGKDAAWSSLLSQAQSVVKTLCSCIESTSIVQVTTYPVATSTITTTITDTSTSTVSTTPTDTTTTTTTITTTETTTPTITSTPSITVTPTSSITATTTATVTVRPPGQYVLDYSNPSCCYNHYDNFPEVPGPDQPAALLQCEAICEQTSNCITIATVHYPGFYACIIDSAPYSSGYVQTPCYGDCDVYTRKLLT